MQALDQIILDTLVEAATIAPYALIDYPNYLNPGAAAIGGDGSTARSASRCAGRLRAADDP
jgi:hypothetical protein